MEILEQPVNLECSNLATGVVKSKLISMIVFNVNVATNMGFFLEEGNLKSLLPYKKN